MSFRRWDRAAGCSGEESRGYSGRCGCARRRCGEFPSPGAHSSGRQWNDDISSYPEKLICDYLETV
nr:MAG TPA: hypothetical protein [Caudoviricetes sp.]